MKYRLKVVSADSVGAISTHTDRDAPCEGGFTRVADWAFFFFVSFFRIKFIVSSEATYIYIILM